MRVSITQTAIKITKHLKQFFLIYYILLIRSSRHLVNCGFAWHVFNSCTIVVLLGMFLLLAITIRSCLWYLQENKSP